MGRASARTIDCVLVIDLPKMASVHDDLETTGPGDVLLDAAGTNDLGRRVQPCFVVLAGDRPGRTYRIDGDSIVGRAASAALRFPFDDISRRHAKISQDDDGAYHIEDLGSRNGIRVNGVPVKSHPLCFGDRVTVGTSVLLLFSQQDGLEEQLLRSQKLESLGRLAGGIAHDFNNLLGTVLTNISFLRSLDGEVSLANSDVVETLEDSEAALRRAVELTRQLLGFARRGKYRDRPTNLSQLVDEVTRLVRRTVSSGIRMELDVEPELIVSGDATQLHQVLMNLMINACDAMPKGGTLKIRLSAAAADRAKLITNQPHIVLEVEDEGIGMDDDTRHRAFEPFFTTKDVGKGTGLGLAMVYGIVKNHGGDVRIESAPDEGTTVRIVLPRVEPPSTKVNKSTATSDHLVVHGRLLLVDDDDLFRSSTRRLLEHLGYRVEDVSSGARAIEVYTQRSDEFGLVLLDLQMPEMNGEQVLTKLLSFDAAVRVLLVTAFADDRRARAAIAAGARGFIQKPFDVDTLLKAIHSAAK